MQELVRYFCSGQHFVLSEAVKTPVCLSGSALAASVCKKITGRLTSAIAKQEDVSVQLEALDIMADMLCR